MSDTPRDERQAPRDDALESRAGHGLAGVPLEDVPLEDVIEACRPQGSDLLDPELAPFARRIAEDPQSLARLHAVQAADRRLVAAFRSVEAPPGLSAQVLAALAAATPAEAPLDGPIVVGSKTRRRKRWALGIGLATAAAVLLAFLFWRSPTTYRAESIADHAQQALETGGAAFQPGVPAKLRLPPQVAQARVEGWAPTVFLERQATLIKLERNGVRATLILAPLRGPAITGRLPRNVYTTGKLAIGVLPDSKRLCVLAVEGNAEAYRRFLESGAVAVQRPRVDVRAVSHRR